MGCKRDGENMDLHDILLLLTVTAASTVEMVEAVTIIVAAGVSRSWRSSLQGAAAAILTLAALVAVFGPTLATLVPLETLQIYIGFLLLLIGGQWLRKAILRSSGFIALRNEAALYQKAVITAKAEAPVGQAKGFDGTSFTMSYKGVFLEGLEVVLIVIGFGASSGEWVLPTAGAGIAAVGIGAIGVALAQPLAKVPENLLKKGVGLMLVSFGTFWLGEGAGIHWPGQDLALIWLTVLYGLLTQALVFQLSRSRPVMAGAK